MQTPKYELKWFFDGAPANALEAFIPVFHHWIQQQCLDELLIDVADYRHVHNGPGVMLIAHDAHYAIDAADGRLGLLYSRRRETHPSRREIDDPRERLASVFLCALSACQRLESDAEFQGQLRFRTDGFVLRINDRLSAPNTHEAFQAVYENLAPFLRTLYPDQEVEVSHASDAASRLTLDIQASDNPGVETLLTRLGVAV
ncbi:MAG: hypothetical protein ETSY1_22565 [Candidatus Entotheonella factor]|uniref:Uncharacterized protein n=1 Tax=Entotheonella factor TaxID=1429438 RepID=W4LHS5_ENTF1|nr:hypothetical protein [Candidatus Entotheonella palauensis]ETW97464.1 MAG: hypothetical protein ETSY1_22565 [Candidatus Entotheonella factor]